MCSYLVMLVLQVEVKRVRPQGPATPIQQQPYIETGTTGMKFLLLAKGIFSCRVQCAV